MFTVNVGGYRSTRNKVNNSTCDYFTATFKTKFCNVFPQKCNHYNTIHSYILN